MKKLLTTIVCAAIAGAVVGVALRYLAPELDSTARSIVCGVIGGFLGVYVFTKRGT